MTIHRAATSFDVVAAAYERGRPEYPDPAVAAVVAALGIGPSSTVVDLAAGTGKLTRLLAGTGARLVAVEPVPGMRAVLRGVLPGVEVVEGTAEHTGLRARCADAVTVGQAFHWFRGEEALAEVHRVLRPGGGLALLWNRRDLTQPVQAEIDAVIDPYRGDTPSLASGEWRRWFDTTALFGPLTEAHVPMEQTLDAEGLVDRMLSVSFVAGLPEGERARVARSLRAVACRHPAPLALRYVTDCYWCRAR